MASRAKFKLGQRVWCIICKHPVQITKRVKGGFLTSCLPKQAWIGDCVRPIHLRPLTKREREDSDGKG